MYQKAGITGIVDYGMGNLLSVYHALEMIGADPLICSHPEELERVERIILPGVGAFRDCMKNLINEGFVDALEETVARRGKPILGVCLGMQAMARVSHEGGEYGGLGWFDAEVVRLQPDNPSLRIPHVGWNDVIYESSSPLFAGLPPTPDFYFVHSYHLQFKDEKATEATCDYGGVIAAAIRRDNIFATQFHPEKSQSYGLKLLENFLKWKP